LFSICKINHSSDYIEKEYELNAEKDQKGKGERYAQYSFDALNVGACFHMILK
jgi:hypothetical protein